METVNFQCGHCGNLLAVSKQYLGQQVRCPHCQQVVLAPSPSSPPPAETPPPQVEEHDSIFGAPASDDLFGAPPEPKIPPHPVPNLELDSPVHPQEPDTLAFGPASPPAATVPDTIVTRVSPDEFGDIERQYSQPPAQTETIAPAPSADPFSTVDTGNEQPVPVQRRPRSKGWHIPLFIIPLISWAILATIAAALLYRDKQQQERDRPHPLEFVPDVEGDHPIRKVGRLDRRVKMPSPDEELPEHLKMKIGETKQLGELEITAERVERGKISIGEEARRDATEVEQNEALKLVLRLKNVSEDLSYVPMDSYFHRWWNANARHPNQGYFTPKQTPYTYLQIGDKKFYGGPAGWNARESSEPREFVVGQNFGKHLAPGESMETFVCTDPRDCIDPPVLRKPRWDDALRRNVGEDPVWRVHLRRGSVEVNGKRKPVTSVIGVTFKNSDIKETGKAG